MSADSGSRRSRVAGVVSLSLSRLWKRVTRTQSGRIVATIGTVALTIAFLVVVTGVALALAEGGVASEDDADVRITPEGSETLSTVDGVEGPRLGESNERAATITDRDGVDHATPILVEKVRLEPAAGGEPRTILVVGVVPDDADRTVAGLPTADLEPGDPHYANGGYDGPRERDIVLSTAAAERLDATEGEGLAVSGLAVANGDDAPSPTVNVVAVEGNEREGASETPVALVHLSELQSTAGAADDQLADRVLIWGDEDGATAAAADAYPDAAVETDDGTDLSALFDDALAFATSLLALIVGLTICASFVATTTGMTVDEDRRTIAILESLGFQTGSRLAIVGLSTLVTTLCGALLGATLGFAGIGVVNAVADATVASDAIARAHPLFIPYAVAVGIASGLVAVPYPLAVAARTSVLEEVGR